MTRFTPETQDLIRQEAARRQQEGTIESYQTPLESAVRLFRERARALHKEQFRLDTNLDYLADQWRKVRESRSGDELDARLAAYMAEGERIARWLKLLEPTEAEHAAQGPADPEARGRSRDRAHAGPTRADQEQEPAPQDLGTQLRRIDIADPKKWQELYALLRSVGGLSGSRKFYSAEDLITIIEEARRDPAHNMSRVTGGGVDLNEQVMRFIALDSSRERGVELQGFRPGDRAIHPFTRKEVTVTSVGTRVADFVPHAYIDAYRRKAAGPLRAGDYQVLVNSPEFFVLRQNRRFVLAGERNVAPSAEIESPTEIESRTLVVPIKHLKHAA